MRKRDYGDYAQDILDSISDLESFIAGLSYDDFIKDKKTINAVIRSIEIIGEATKKLPSSIKKKHPSIPWKKMAGMRDKLIHEYFGVDLEILWKVVKTEIPSTKPMIELVVNEIKSS